MRETKNVIIHFKEEIMKELKSQRRPLDQEGERQTGWKGNVQRDLQVAKRLGRSH